MRMHQEEISRYGVRLDMGMRHYIADPFSLLSFAGFQLSRLTKSVLKRVTD